MTRALKDNVFRDLALLDKALDADAADVDPQMEVGAEREVSGDAVSKFEWSSGAGGNTGKLMKIRVVAPGWNWRGTVLANSIVERASECHATASAVLRA